MLGRAAGWSLEGWLGWAASWSLKSRLAGLLGRAADWSLEGWLDCWLVPGGLAWLLGRATKLVTAQLIFSVDT